MKLLPPALFGLLALSLPKMTHAQIDIPSLLRTMAANETAAEEHRERYLYKSEERSDRTGGRLWTERVAETEAGRVRFLIAEDGRPLPEDRKSAERARLADIAAHPDLFAKHEQARKNDERHAKEMLALLPKAFLFDPPAKEGGYLRMTYRPNPAYAPQSIEERVLHAMGGVLVIDPVAVRLRHLDGRLPEDVNIGFGLLATIKAGSNFATTREQIGGSEWKTAVIDTDVNGRAIFFKAIGKKEHTEHREFKRLADNITVAQAVDMLLR